MRKPAQAWDPGEPWLLEAAWCRLAPEPAAHPWFTIKGSAYAAADADIEAWFKTDGLWVTPKVVRAAPTKGFHVLRVTHI